VVTAIRSALFAVPFLIVASLSAQPANPDAPKPRFEVATVRLNKSGGTGAALDLRPGGRLVGTNQMVRNLIRIAFNLQPHQIIGGPAWIDADRFDIAAKSADADLDAKGMMSPEQFTLRLQALLEERFNMKTHWETRQVPAYAMVLAGKLGPTLKAHTGNCDRESNGIVPPPGSPTSHCVTVANRTPSSATVLGTGITMDTLARNLSNAAGRTVVDRTGLSGIYDVELAFTPEPSPETPGPSLFTAVQEQLGLRLEAERAPIRVLVIDAVERPTPD
jgi:uncharacterized protein (TIGR03435 family)